MSTSVSRFPSSAKPPAAPRPADWRRTVRIVFPWIVMVAAAALGVAVVAIA